MNNKGQSLVLFTLLIPITILIFAMVVDIAKMTLLRDEIDHISYLVLDYALDSYTSSNLDLNTENIDISNKVKKLILKNQSNVEQILIKNTDNSIYLTITCKEKMSIFKNIKIFTIESNYVGYLEENEKIIKRNK